MAIIYVTGDVVGVISKDDGTEIDIALVEDS